MSVIRFGKSEMDVLYHYCSPSAFVAILTGKSLWLSSMSLSNDSMEGRVLAEVFSRRLQKDGIDPAIASLLQDLLGELEQTFDGLGFCLSEDGDLLSQWRGYAADGYGFSIGFSRKYLETLSVAEDRKLAAFKLKRVIYDADEQEAEIDESFAYAKKAITDGRLKYPSPLGLLSGLGSADAESDFQRRKSDYERALRSVTLKMFLEFRKLFTLKNRAFSEEREWRLMSFITKKDADPCQFRASKTGLIPYRSYDMLDLHMQQIYEVIIGPKNTTPDFVVRKLLQQAGFDNVSIKRSSATYR